MTRVRAMLELAERCEKATGPDRRIDMQIEIMANPTKPWIVGEKPGPWPRDPVYGTLADFWEWATDESKEPPEINAPAYTASLDAAVSLVPEGWRKWIYDADEGRCICRIERDDETLPELEVGSNAPTWPLAITAAALRARAADTPKVTPSDR